MFIFYFLPAVGWGLMPVIAALTKAKPINQLIGTAIMAFVFSLLFFLVTKPPFDWSIMLFPFLSGCFWAIGQYFQFYAFQLLPVSEAMPISNGTQLIGTTLIAALCFKEWTSIQAFIIGISGIVVIILGIICTSYKEQTQRPMSFEKQKRAITWLLVSSAALTIYVILPRLRQTPAAAVIFPQSLGMVSMVFILSIKEKKQLVIRDISTNLFTGLAWSSANLSLFSLMPIMGVAKSFTFSQLSVLISIAGGLLFFNVKKTPKEKGRILFGALLMLMGIFLIGSIKR
ncbi:GRP family sugar transporter [Candidatus Enterococcus mansonii]|uniref:Sugar transport protein n=1 Tax=Candidatus Enterococcus mansonii TaxID=1834181 RepID=A0A242CCE1_9ENTE|nr:GRP family sugar transporter [Enterococcus sp. 4G2_DIV0659]OTO07925.1 hypothetical protein A5880_002195 [Enterococcus sp. 4G2_DIV0659]